MRQLPTVFSMGIFLLVSVAGCLDDARSTENAPDATDVDPCTAQADDSPSDPDAAVNAALKWLSEHQLADGCWSFDHRAGNCRGRCDGFGTATVATNAATAIVLLPFLAAGQTHQRGEHQEVVGRGVAYLIKKAKPSNGGVSFLEAHGTMYSHGLATIAICEAYRQTKDKQLKSVCQSALDFICHAQDPVGGGWRYAPRQPGDNSVSGWQVAALRSGQLAGFDVPAKTLQGASQFLDSVQADDGAGYGYVQPGAKNSMTASGLMSRMHLGWRPDNKRWRRGVALLEAVGPSPSDMYFNYHASQVLAQRGGEPWTTWHESIRRLLLAGQATDGHAAGSWNYGNGHVAARGGRLVNTSLAAMILALHDRQLGIFQVAEKED